MIRGAKAHVASGLGKGADYRANFEPLYAPFDCVIARTYYGDQGGKWLWLNDPEGVSLQFAHLQEYYAQQGESVKRGQMIALTGNTGKITTGPHLHIQILKNKTRLDPEKYDWNKYDNMESEEYMTKEQFRSHVQNVVNGVYINYYGGSTGRESEVEAHVNAIMAAHEQEPAGQEYCISNWVNKQKDEAEFKEKVGNNLVLQTKLDQIRQIVG